VGHNIYILLCDMLRRWAYALCLSLNNDTFAAQILIQHHPLYWPMFSQISETPKMIEANIWHDAVPDVLVLRPPALAAGRQPPSFRQTRIGYSFHPASAIMTRRPLATSFRLGLAASEMTFRLLLPLDRQIRPTSGLPISILDYWHVLPK